MHAVDSCLTTSASALMANGLGGSVSTSLFVDNQRDAVIPMTGVCLIVKGLT